MNKIRIAKYKIGQVVKHRLYSFRGVVFDIDPEFNNTEEWWQSIPAEVRPRKDQPFYHLFAENADTEYVAYVSEQNLLPDTSDTPIRHPQVAQEFVRDEAGDLSPAQQPDELMRARAGKKKARPKAAPLVFPGIRTALFFARAGAAPSERRESACPALVLALQLLARLFRLLLQLFLQFALLFFEHLRIGRRPVIGLGEIGERQRQADRAALHVDRLDW